MRPAGALELPAGKAVELKPGGYHVMLMDLPKEVKAGETVPLQLVLEASDGKRQTVDVQAPVRAVNAAAGAAPPPRAYVSSCGVCSTARPPPPAGGV